MKCFEHPGSKAVDTCSVCGHGVCAVCRGYNDGETLCPDCVERRYGFTHHISNPDISTMDGSRRVSRKMTVISVIFMTALYAGTLWSYLASWRGGALATSAVVFVLISLIFELVLLWRNAAKARWGIAITALMNLVLAIFCALQSDDPTGLSSVVCMIFLFPVTMYMALYDLVSDDTLLILAFVSYLILATILVVMIRKTYPL